MRRLWVLGMCMAMLTASPGVAQAMVYTDGGAKYTLSCSEQYTPSAWTSEMGYGTRAAQKLIFGVKNLLVGWVDLFTEPNEARQAGTSLLTGIGAGVKDAILNELGGAIHLVTFPITGLDVALPEGGTELF